MMKMLFGANVYKAGTIINREDEQSASILSITEKILPGLAVYCEYSGNDGRVTQQQ